MEQPSGREVSRISGTADQGVWPRGCKLHFRLLQGAAWSMACGLQEHLSPLRKRKKSTFRTARAAHLGTWSGQK